MKKVLNRFPKIFRELSAWLVLRSDRFHVGVSVSYCILGTCLRGLPWISAKGRVVLSDTSLGNLCHASPKNLNCSTAFSRFCDSLGCLGRHQHQPNCEATCVPLDAGCSFVAASAERELGERSEPPNMNRTKQNVFAFSLLFSQRHPI